MKVLLTGGTGFLGSQLTHDLNTMPAIDLTVVARRKVSMPVTQVTLKDSLGPDTDWSEALPGNQVVIHAAARAHILNESVADPLAEFRKVNVAGTLALARQAATVGVRRFIFISSIGVNGNVSARPFTAEDDPHPIEPYAVSKWEAEQGLWEVHRETGMEVVMIRPPLVYGPNAPGNFESLIRWIEKGVPLPLGAIHNKRSLVGIKNLADLIIRCIDHPAAANQVFLAGDGEDLSTTQLLHGVAKAMGKPARLIPIPVWMLQSGATLLGRKATAQRLLGSLQVDIRKTCDLLGWRPPFTVDEGLEYCFKRPR